jgi:hypothetical protein
MGLLDLLRIEDYRYRLGLDRNRSHLTLLGRYLAAGTRADGPQIDPRLQLDGRYLEWRTAFTTEELDQALVIAEDMWSRVSAMSACDQERAGRSFAAFGVTLKALERLADSTRVFDEGVARFPESRTGRRSRLSNIAALALRSDPKRSLECYRDILASDDGDFAISDRLHVEADVAMALFLSDDMARARTQSVRAIDLADANGVPAQAARGRNILGCVTWCAGETRTAVELFDRAVLDAERSYMERFVWRFRTNLASAAVEWGDRPRALANARSAEDRILKGRISGWKDKGLPQTHTSSRWYVALLSIGLTYDRCKSPFDLDRLLVKLRSLTGFESHLRDTIGGRLPAAVFAESTHLHGGRIMITG